MLKISAYQNVSLPEKAGRLAVEPTKNGRVSKPGSEASFRTELDQQLAGSEKVKFSAHARARLYSRGVQLNEQQLEAISQAIDKADARGARESLILADEAAYVVSVKNRTVITAFDRENLRDGVFTSIDSAVIL